METPKLPTRVGDTVETEHARVHIEAGYIVALTLDVRDQTIEGARALVSMVETIAQSRGQPVGLLFDIRKLRWMSREARLHYHSPQASQAVTGVAILIDSGLSRVIGNFLMGLYLGTRDLRLYTDVDEARAWLTSLGPEGEGGSQ